MSHSSQKDQFLQIRISSQQKKQFQLQANDQGLTVSEWIRQLLDRDSSQPFDRQGLQRELRSLMLELGHLSGSNSLSQRISRLSRYLDSLER